MGLSSEDRKAAHAIKAHLEAIGWFSDEARTCYEQEGQSKGAFDPHNAMNMSEEAVQALRDHGYRCDATVYTKKGTPVDMAPWYWTDCPLNGGDPYYCFFQFLDGVRLRVEAASVALVKSNDPMPEGRGL